MLEILLHPDYFNAVRTGAKRTTIRKDHRTEFGPAVLVNSEDANMRIEIDIHRTTLTTLEELTDVEARADGFLSLGQLHSAMQRHYPDVTMTDGVTIYSFTRTDRAGG